MNKNVADMMLGAFRRLSLDDIHQSKRMEAASGILIYLLGVVVDYYLTTPGKQTEKANVPLKFIRLLKEGLLTEPMSPKDEDIYEQRIEAKIGEIERNLER